MVEEDKDAVAQRDAVGRVAARTIVVQKAVTQDVAVEFAQLS